MKETIVKNVKEAIQSMLSFVNEKNKRAAEIIALRFGLKTAKKNTLEKIGKKYDITRERIRQIEQEAISILRRLETAESMAVLEEIKKEVFLLGRIVPEDTLLGIFSQDPIDQNHISFLLSLRKDFIYMEEKGRFYACWAVDKNYALTVQKSIDNLESLLEERDVLTEERIISIFSGFLGEISASATKEGVLTWLSISKRIGKNSQGEWGKKSSCLIFPKVLADYAYLVMRKHGKTMHFKEVAEAIEKVSGKKVNTATCHNELGKNKLFALVGRGQYALVELGYETATAADAIKKVLKDFPQGAYRDVIIDKVLEKYSFKKNTVLVNLQSNEDLFEKVGGRSIYTVYKLVSKK